MLVAENRPRTLSWTHSGPLLFGDWGTSRLYVLGLAFYYTAHGSIAFLLGTGLLMVAVAWAYTVICRCFPDGGGVYSAGRQIHPLVGIVGSTLLLGGYLMTAVISVVEALHYFGLPRSMTVPLAMVSILAIGFINWFGAKNSGRFAFIIATISLVATLAIGAMAIPFIPAGLQRISFDHMPPPGQMWIAFTKLCLAMAGIEAVANMTGLMKQPVARTAKLTIWPVLAEVVLLNIVFGIALAGLPNFAGQTIPDAIALEGQELPQHVLAYRDTAMGVVASQSASQALGTAWGLWAGRGASIVFGLLLLSAANTAIMAMVSVLYSMAADRELPKPLGRLNYSGVPWIGLVVSCIACAMVTLVEQDPEVLAELYVLGVCGAITVSVGSCVINRGLEIRRFERAGMGALTLLLLAITATIIIFKVRATVFSGSLVAGVLLMRFGIARWMKRAPAPLETPEHGWLAEVRAAAPAKLDPSMPRIMLAARGRDQAEFAVDLARRRGAALFVMFVRTVRMIDVVPGQLPKLEDDPDAQSAVGTVGLLAKQAGVPIYPIYVVSSEIANEILDYTVTFACDTLIMGKSKRTPFARRVQGDVVAEVARNLPDNVALITRSTSVPAHEYPNAAPPLGGA